MDRIEKVSASDPSVNRINTRQTDPAGAQVSRHTAAQSAPHAGTPTPEAAAPDDSVVLSAGARAALSNDLQAALLALNLPLLSAATPDELAAALQTIVLTNTPAESPPSGAAPQPPTYAQDAAPPAPDFGVETDRIELSGQKNAAVALLADDAAELQTPGNARDPARPDTTSPLLPERRLGASGSPEFPPLPERGVGGSGSAEFPPLPERGVGGSGSADQTQPLPLAAGWFALNTNPPSYCQLAVQRDDGRSSKPQTDAPPSYSIALNLYTEHVGVVRIRLSLARPDLTATLGFSAAAFAEEAAESLPQLESALARTGFRRATVRATVAASGDDGQEA